jgi:membrane-anchored protein YejM (alkaline phosphatase superfamily)
LVAGQLWLIEIALLALLCGAYTGTAHPETPSGWFFLLGGRLSCAASLSLLPGFVSLAAAALLRAPRVLALSSGVLWSLALFLVYVDTRIYGIFRYHFNGLVWNVLTTPGSDEAVHFSRREVVSVLLALATLVVLQSGAFLVLWRHAVRRARLALPLPRLARPGLVWKLVLVPNMILVAGVYAWADLRRDPQVLAFTRVYPFYPRLTVKRFAARFLGIDMRERPGVDMPVEGILLDYPREKLVFEPAAPRPNVLVIVIDSLRADMLDPEVMPRVSALARGGRTFRDHLSSGNATRFGIFGLLYGLHGSYWGAVSDEHRSPVLVDVLLERGYQLRILTSASMDFPEFRSTAWVRAEHAVEDRLPSERRGGRDDGVARRFEEWLDERDAAAPFFAFLLLDAPHQRYYFPEECARFRPFLDDVSYAAVSAEAPLEVRTQLFNRYRNAVHYADQTTGRVLDALAAHSLTEETLVVVTGDHGEEFFESGVWGHTSNFTRPQVHVPLVLAGPEVQPGVEERPTSHVDLSVTVVELLGADPAARHQWSLGENLLAPPPARARVVSGWDTLGVFTSDVILEVPMAGYGGAEIAVYDGRWQRRFDDEEILAREGKVLGTLALECRRFLR